MDGETDLILRTEDEDLKPESLRQFLDAEESLTAPWLFSCQTDTPTSSLQVLLEFHPESTEELDSGQWRREEDMWIAFLEDLPEELGERKPESFHLLDLRKSARRALLSICRGEHLLVVRRVPGKETASQNPTSITLVAMLAAALSEAWQRTESTEPEALGRIALVLEGDGIGTRLRAGRKKFKIEPLN